MIKINLKADGGKETKKALESLPQKFRIRVLKNALNGTATQALKAMHKDVNQIYDVKLREFKSSKNKKIHIYRATNNRLNSIIHIRSHPSELVDFMVKPAKGDPKSPPDVLTGHVVRQNALKRLFHGRDKKGNSNKAFFVKFKSGHVTVASRMGGAQYPIAPLMTLSISQMIGALRMHKILSPQINGLLRAEVSKQIDRLRKRGEI